MKRVCCLQFEGRLLNSMFKELSTDRLIVIFHKYFINRLVLCSSSFTSVPRSKGQSMTFFSHFCLTTTAMADLYLSQQEATVLSYVTLAWGFVQWWDLIDKYVVQRFRTASTNPDTRPDSTQTRHGNSTSSGADQPGL